MFHRKPLAQITRDGLSFATHNSRRYYFPLIHFSVGKYPFVPTCISLHRHVRHRDIMRPPFAPLHTTPCGRCSRLQAGRLRKPQQGRDGHSSFDHLTCHTHTRHSSKCRRKSAGVVAFEKVLRIDSLTAFASRGRQPNSGVYSGEGRVDRVSSGELRSRATGRKHCTKEESYNENLHLLRATINCKWSGQWETIFFALRYSRTPRILITKSSLKLMCVCVSSGKQEGNGIVTCATKGEKPRCENSLFDIEPGSGWKFQNYPIRNTDRTLGSCTVHSG